MCMQETCESVSVTEHKLLLLLLLLLSHFSHVRLFATPWTAAYQAPAFMGFSRQEYWSGVPLPSPGTQTSGYQRGEGRINEEFGISCCLLYSTDMELYSISCNNL